MDKIPLPNKFELKDTGTNQARLTIEPLFAGFGLTIGNALRRVLLSSIPGAAVTALKIKNVDHEFSTLKGVKEDVVDIILNFKKIRLKIHTDEEVRLKINVKGKKNVTAKDIETNSAVEIMNPDTHLATLTSESSVFEVELLAKRGRGYWPTEARDSEKKEIGVIAIDAIFTPVVNVAMEVENVRVGQVTNFERIILDIETDGIITPKEAVALASQIVVDHFQLLIESDLEPQTERTDLNSPKEKSDDNLNDNSSELFTGTNEIEAPTPKKRGRPRKTETIDELADDFERGGTNEVNS